MLNIPLRRDWLNKRVLTIADFLDSWRIVLRIEEIQDSYGIKINFIEYHTTRQNNANFLDWRESTVCNEFLPRNSAMNFLLNIHERGSLKLYRKLKNPNEHVLGIHDSWISGIDIEKDKFSLSTSFS